MPFVSLPKIVTLRFFWAGPYLGRFVSPVPDGSFCGLYIGVEEERIGALSLEGIGVKGVIHRHDDLASG